MRTPSLDSAVIKSDRLGGNFAYSTVEGHAYAAVSPVVQNVVQPVGVSYTAHHVPLGYAVSPAVVPQVAVSHHVVPHLSVAHNIVPQVALTQAIIPQVGSVVPGSGVVVGAVPEAPAVPVEAPISSDAAPAPAPVPASDDAVEVEAA